MEERSLKYCSSYASDHARSGAAHLQVELAYSAAVEHGVETGYLVDLHGSHVENLGDLVHRRESEVVLVLLLRYEEQGDDCGVLVV